MAKRSRAEGVELVVEPCMRFESELGKQAAKFFLDPLGERDRGQGLLRNQPLASGKVDANGMSV